jgi:PAS domain S-box-containing protein
MAETAGKEPSDELETARKRIRELEAAAGEVERVRGLLAQSESEYQTAFENSGTGMVVVRDDMTILLVNQRIREIFGFSNEEVRYKKKWIEFVCPSEVERLKRYHSERRKNPDTTPGEYEFTLKDKDGNIRDVLANVAMIPGTTNSLVSMNDITLRKIMERNLRESEQRFKETAELLPGIICEMDPSLRITYVNKIGLQTFGFSEEQYKKGIDVKELIFPEDRERVAGDMNNIFSGDYGTPAEYRLLTKKGGPVHMLINAAPLMKKGAETGLRACIVDITGRVAAEARLKESEERFKSIFQKSPIGLALFDLQGRLLEMNGSFGGMFPGSIDSCNSDGQRLFSLLTLTDGEKNVASKRNVDQP